MTDETLMSHLLNDYLDGRVLNHSNGILSKISELDNKERELIINNKDVIVKELNSLQRNRDFALIINLPKVTNILNKVEDVHNGFLQDYKRLQKSIISLDNTSDELRKLRIIVEVATVLKEATNYFPKINFYVLGQLRDLDPMARNWIKEIKIYKDLGETYDLLWKQYQDFSENIQIFYFNEH